jgi:hypothetical protein
MEGRLAALSDFQLYFLVVLSPESGLFNILKLFLISLLPYLVYLDSFSYLLSSH